MSTVNSQQAQSKGVLKSDKQDWNVIKCENRHGKLSLVQIASYSSTKVWVIDVTTLGSLAFKTASDTGRTLQIILEHRYNMKVIQDSPTFLEGGHKLQRHSYSKSSS